MRLQLNIYAYTNQKVTTNVREGRRKKGIDMFTKNKIEHESTREDSKHYQGSPHLLRLNKAKYKQITNDFAENSPINNNNPNRQNF